MFELRIVISAVTVFKYGCYGVKNDVTNVFYNNIIMTSNICLLHIGYNLKAHQPSIFSSNSFAL